MRKLLAVPAAFLLLAAATAWLRDPRPQGPPAPRRSEKAPMIAEEQPVPALPAPPTRLASELPKPLRPATAPVPPPVIPPPQTQPWRPGYMGMNGVDGPSGDVLVTQVFPHTAAERAGLRVGDVVVEFNGTAAPTLAALFQLARSAGEGAPVSLRIRRAGVDLYLGLQLGPHPLYN